MQQEIIITPCGETNGYNDYRILISLSFIKYENIKDFHFIVYDQTTNTYEYQYEYILHDYWSPEDPDYLELYTNFDYENARDVLDLFLDCIVTDWIPQHYDDYLHDTTSIAEPIYFYDGE